jgi:hypothetical protein
MMHYLLFMRRLFIVGLLLISICTSAQYYSSGSDPAHLSWKQVKTPVVQLVFEENLQKQALRLAAFMDSIAPHIAGTLNHRPKSIPLLLHNHSAYSNGFVTWAPKRSEFYTMPSQNLLSTDWLEHLAIHEYRHVVQIDKLNQGLTKWLTYLVGEQATGGVLGLYLPMWFLEGDAVITETTLTQSGRGRSYAFNNELKAQLLSQGAYSYDKAYMGSYKDYVPDYYKMGYLLTAKARQLYGPELWENTLQYVGRNSWNLRAFNRGIKRATGMNQKHLYEQMFEQIRQEWAAEKTLQTLTQAKAIEVSEEDYLRYLSPVAINDSTLIAELRGPGIRSQIVSIHIPTGHATTLTYTGLRENEPLSANQNLVVWSELQYHPRWEHQSWSVLRTHDLKTGKNKTITRQTCYFAPTLHPKKDLIAAVEVTTDYQFFIVLVDARNGECLQRIPTPENYFALTPSWNLNGENLVTVLLSPNGKAIYHLTPEGVKWSRLTPWSYDEYRHPQQSGNQIWYTAQGNYGDEIFLLNTLTGESHQVTATPFGAAYATVTPASQQLIYTAYSEKGPRPVMHADSSLVMTSDLPASMIHQLVEDLSHQEPVVENTEVSAAPYPVKKYSKWNLLNVHSWAPAFVDFSDESIYTGLSVMSQNLLGTTIITAGYNANPAYETEKYNIKLTYRGLYPIIDINYSFGDTSFEKEGLYTIGEDDFVYEINTQQTIHHHYLRAGAKIPFDISRGHYSRHFEVGARLTWQQRSEIAYPLTQYRLVGETLIATGTTTQYVNPKMEFYGMEYNLSFQNIRRGTSRDVGTRFGQALNLFYRHSPWGTYDNGHIIGFLSRLYLPGAGRHHALSLSNDFQQKQWGEAVETTGDYYHHNRFSNIVGYPRGYSFLENDQLYLLRATYMMPLWNPDFSLGKFMYVKRLRLNLFYDQAYAQYSRVRMDTQQKYSFSSSPASYGIELHADSHFFRFVLPFSVGARVSYRTADQTVFGEFILQTGLSGFLVN